LKPFGTQPEVGLGVKLGKSRGEALPFGCQQARATWRLDNQGDCGKGFLCGLV